MRVTTMTPEPTNNPTKDPDDVIYISAQGINEKYRKFIVKSTDREIKTCFVLVTTTVHHLPENYSFPQLAKLTGIPLMN